jgi:hypothetical protein
VKRSAGYRALRPSLFSLHPTDIWSEQDSKLTFVAFGLAPGRAYQKGGMAVFAVHDTTSRLVSARVAEFGDGGLVAAIHTLHQDAELLPTGA